MMMASGSEPVRSISVSLSFIVIIIIIIIIILKWADWCLQPNSPSPSSRTHTHTLAASRLRNQDSHTRQGIEHTLLAYP